MQMRESGCEELAVYPHTHEEKMNIERPTSNVEWGKT
jgi:hypothetical protein